MRVGLVGNGTDKFTALGQERAREAIRDALVYADTMVSGHSPVGGIDIWAEEEALNLGLDLDLKIPEIQQWNPPAGYGYKERNLDIARDSDALFVILAKEYPLEYTGRRFDLCYHCARTRPDFVHVKSGGCWTGNQAAKLGVEVTWMTVDNY